MKKVSIILSIILILQNFAAGQDFGNLPKIEKNKLMLDLEILYQALDQYHTGMYWYTPKDSVKRKYDDIKGKLQNELNVIEFHKLIAPLVALSREDHTNIYLPESTLQFLRKEIRFFPFVIKFLDQKLYIIKNGSDSNEMQLEGKIIESINGETPLDIVKKIGTLYANDGFIQTAKLHDLGGFNFAKYYYFFYGEIEVFDLEFSDFSQTFSYRANNIDKINQHLKNRYVTDSTYIEPDILEYRLMNDTVAYLGIHSFSNSRIKKESQEKNFKRFLKKSFASIANHKIKTLIIDIGHNGGGSEGNEGLLYSYFGENYQKYTKVVAKRQKITLDNGVDAPIRLKTFGYLERILLNKKLEDNSYERRNKYGLGLMAYKKKPKNKFKGNIYIIISPQTYSGASEFSNMMFSNRLATFVGQETGGSYYGNTSGYSRKISLPHSRIVIEIPLLQFVMNVEPIIPFGRGVIPHYKVIPTYEEYINNENVALEYILKDLVIENADE